MKKKVNISIFSIFLYFKTNNTKDDKENVPFKVVSISDESRPSIFSITELLVDDANDFKKSNNSTDVLSIQVAFYAN